MSHPLQFEDDDPQLVRLRRLTLAYPGAEERISHGRPTFRAGRIFIAFGGSEKIRPGEHRRVPGAMIFKPDLVELPALDEDSRFFVPAYYGPSGWRAVDLAAPTVDWVEVAELVDASYRLIAPARLVAELDQR